MGRASYSSEPNNPVSAQAVENLYVGYHNLPEPIFFMRSVFYGLSG